MNTDPSPPPVVSRTHRAQETFFRMEWIFWGALVVAAAGVGALFQFPNRRNLLETSLDALTLCAVAAVPVFGRYLAGLPLPHRLLLIGMTGMMCIGQFAHRDFYFFPFVQWSMYTAGSARETITYQEIIATLENDERLLINPERLFPSLGFGTQRMANTVRNRLADALESEQGAAIFNQLLESLAKAHEHYGANRRPINHLEVVEVTVPVSKRNGPEASRRTVWSWKPTP